MRNYRIELKWALIFIAMSLLWMFLERLAGLHDAHIDKHPVLTNFIAIPAIAIYVLALLDKRKNYYNGVMNYRQGFVTGFVITIIVTLLSPLTQYITSSIITPEYFTNAANHAVSHGKMTKEQAADYFSLRNYIVQGLMGALIIGIITSAIVALFTTRKQKHNH